MLKPAAACFLQRNKECSVESNSFFQTVGTKSVIAKYISIIGHPFLTIPIFLIVILFAREGVANAGTLAMLIIGGIFIPISIRTYIGVRRGKYTNLDVSDQRQRQQWFMLTTALVLLVTALLWITKQDIIVCVAMTVSLFLMIVSQLINFVVKASMHVAYHTYLSFVVFFFNQWVGILFLLFLPMLAWSRLYLKRHTKPEVFSGLVLGLFFGSLFLVWINLWL